MRRHKQLRRVEVVAPSFLSLPGLIIGSNRIATMHRRLATRLAGTLPLTIRELPFSVPPIREVLQWHMANSNDAGLRWVVERIVAMAQEHEPIGTQVIPFDPFIRDAVASTYRGRTRDLG